MHNKNLFLAQNFADLVEKSVREDRDIRSTVFFMQLSTGFSVLAIAERLCQEGLMTVELQDKILALVHEVRGE